MENWQTPKTDWTAETFINISDLQRIVGNIEYLKEMSEMIFGAYDIEEMNKDKSYNSQWYAREVNTIENNLEKINRMTYNLDIGDKMQFADNGRYIDYNELNRIENASLKLYETMKTQIEILSRLSFRLGSGKPIASRIFN